MTMESSEFERVKVLVETAERSFRGYVYRPCSEPTHRLSDHLNEYNRRFLCLSDVQVNDRGQVHRPGEKREFVAISVAAIHYIAPETDL